MAKTKKPPLKLERTFTLTRADAGDAEGTVKLAFASEEPYDRGWGIEVLECTPESVDLSRLNNGGALLLNHSVNDQIGVNDEATVDSDRMCRATVRFSKSAKAQEILQDVRDGIRRLVSVGYMVDKWEVTKGENGAADTFRALKWTPYEVSIVSIPADASVGVGRSLQRDDEPDPDDPDEEGEADEDDKQEKSADEDTEDLSEDPSDDENRENEDTSDDDDPDERAEGETDDDETISDQEKNKSKNHTPMSTTPAPKATTGAEVTDARAKETARIREIAAAGKRFEIADDVVQKFIAEGKSVRDFQTLILDEQEKRNKETAPVTLGMNDKELSRFSVMRAIRLLAEKKPLDGLEKEASDAYGKLIGRDAAGFFIPGDILFSGHRASSGMRTRMGRRDLSAGTPTAGGNTVETFVDGASLIELLRNKMVTPLLGVRTLGGIRGNLAIPSQTGGATAQWLAEAAAGTPSSQTVGQILLSPKHLQGATAFTKQLLAQSSIDVEAFVREDLMAVLALAKDLAILTGTGASGQPTGIANTSGIGSVTFGAAATYAKIQAFETAVENANALLGNCAYVMSPNVKGSLKTKNRFSNTFSPLWADDNTVNGYTAMSTKQAAALATVTDSVLFGNFNDAVSADWDGFDVVVDPYSLSLNNQVRVVLHHMTDVAVRHAGSFALSTDSGAQ